jgi:antitoxin VapB
VPTAKLFKNGRRQAVRLPAEFRFDGDEVLIRRDPVTGDVILSARSKRFEDWLQLRDRLLANLPADAVYGLEDLRDRRPAPERAWP